MSKMSERIERLEQELRDIDNVMARRPALDKKTRVENIAHAITTAATADALARENARLTDALKGIEYSAGNALQLSARKG